MSLLSEIKDILKLVAYNQRVAKWFVIILVIVCGGAFFYYKNIYKPKPESDCAFIKQQNRELLAFILEARKEVEGLVKPTAYLHGANESFFMYASFDTIPKRQEQKKAAKLLSKFDSVLNKIKQDSINRAMQKSKS